MSEKACLTSINAEAIIFAFAKSLQQLFPYEPSIITQVQSLFNSLEVDSDFSQLKAAVIAHAELSKYSNLIALIDEIVAQMLQESSQH